MTEWAERAGSGLVTVGRGEEIYASMGVSTTLDPGFRRDDVGKFTVASKTTVIPAKAGIQCLLFVTLS
jgi:hypothetical protein